MLLRDLAFEESGMKNARTVIEPQRFKWYDIGNTVIGRVASGHLRRYCNYAGLYLCGTRKFELQENKSLPCRMTGMRLSGNAGQHLHQRSAH